MDNWLVEGLKELGLTIKEYNNLSKKEKEETDDLLKELGHI